MGLVSATTIIRSLAIFHITLAAYFIRNPKVIADQNMVFLLGESMQLVSKALLMAVTPADLLSLRPASSPSRLHQTPSSAYS